MEYSSKLFNITSFNLKTENLIVVGTIRFFFNDENVSKLQETKLYVVPPDLDIPRFVTVKSAAIENLKKQILKLNFYEKFNYEALVKKSLLIEKTYAESHFVAKNVSFKQNLIGKVLVDKKLGKVGAVVDVLDGPQNLLCVDNGGKEVLVPIVDEIIKEVTETEIYAKLPEGLLGINEG